MPLLQSRRPCAPLLALLLVGSLAAHAQGAGGAGLVDPPLLQAPDHPEEVEVPAIEAAPPAPAGPAPSVPVARPDVPHASGDAYERAPRDAPAASEDTSGSSHFRGPPAAAVRSLRDVGLPPPASERLRALERELVALPVHAPRSGLTLFGEVLTEASATFLLLGGLGMLDARTEFEFDAMLVLSATSLLLLPVGALSWAIGAAIDHHSQRSLDRRRHTLRAEIRRETTFDPSW